MKRTIIAFVFLIAAACIPLADCDAEDGVGPLYFSSPQQAVRLTQEMLLSHDWPRLARYYDLSSSRVSYQELARGAYFHNKRSKVMDAAGFWRWRQPFDPRFQYQSASAANHQGIVHVEVSIAIDEGFGAIRRGFQSFRMRKTSRGYQLLLELKK